MDWHGLCDLAVDARDDAGADRASDREHCSTALYETNPALQFDRKKRAACALTSSPAPPFASNPDKPAR
jgi:hypothetical protein